MAEQAWAARDLERPHEVADKARRVRAMFSAIAPSYDLNNRVHSLGRDRAWRRRAVALSGLRDGEVVLDVACGTGDLALAFAEGSKLGVGTPGAVIGLDFTFDMLRLAAEKGRDRAQASGAVAAGVQAGPTPSWITGDATALPLPDGCVDVVSIAFGIRNVDRPERALAEFARVLRPGGRLVVLEFSLPRFPPLRWLYNLYFRHVLPRTASWIARDRSGAYHYLPRSVNTYIGRERMAAMLAEAGFEGVTAHPLTFGVAVVYRGVRAG